MKSLEALYKKLNLLGEIWFDLITFCQDERTCVMYFSEFFYPSCGVFGNLDKIEKKNNSNNNKKTNTCYFNSDEKLNIVRVPRCPCFDATRTSLKSRWHELRHPSFRAEDGKQNTVDCRRLTRTFAVRRLWWNINESEIRKKS